MNAKQLLIALDNASMTSGDADGRRLLADAANNLRGAIQIQRKIDALDTALANHSDNSNQGASQYAELRRRRNDLPATPLADAIDSARRWLEEWG